MKSSIQIFIFLLALLSSTQAFAWPPTYGSEFNFSSDLLHGAWNARGVLAGAVGSAWQKPAEAEKKAAQDFAREVQAACGNDCRIIPRRGKFQAMEYEVKFKNGFSFTISVDPSCVEIITPPETLAWIKQNEALTQKFIFGIAEKIGLTRIQDMPAHFNVGLRSAFGDDAKSFLRYFTNYQNNQSLAAGALGKDFGNAPPLSHLKPQQREAFSKIVEDVNSGKLRSAEKAAQRIQDEVYTSTPGIESEAAFHYQGIGLKQIHEGIPAGEDRPFELRAPRQPPTAHDRTLFAELMEKRIEFEKSSNAPVAFLDPMAKRWASDSELANQFRMYLLEMGADWEKYKGLLPPSLRSQPADVFILGRINWADPKEVSTLKSYLSYIGSSVWVRARIFGILSTPEARTSAHFPEVMRIIDLELGEHANSAARENAQHFLQQIYKTMNHKAPGCGGYFQQLLKH